MEFYASFKQKSIRMSSADPRQNKGVWDNICIPRDKKMHLCFKEACQNSFAFTGTAGC